jgi:hypothetical protein
MDGGGGATARLRECWNAAASMFLRWSVGGFTTVRRQLLWLAFGSPNQPKHSCATGIAMAMAWMGRCGVSHVVFGGIQWIVLQPGSVYVYSAVVLRDPHIRSFCDGNLFKIKIKNKKKNKKK